MRRLIAAALLGSARRPRGFGAVFELGAFVGDAINTVDFNSGALRWRAVLYNSATVRDGTAPIVVGTDAIPETHRPYVFAAGRGGGGATASGFSGAGGGGGGSVFLGRLSAVAAVSGDSLRLAVAPADGPTLVKAQTLTASLSVFGGGGGVGGQPAPGSAGGPGVASTVAAGIDGDTLVAHGASGGGIGGVGATWVNGIGSGSVTPGNNGGAEGGGGGGGGGSALFAGIAAVSNVGAAGRVGQPVAAYGLSALTDLMAAVGLPSQFGVGGAGGGTTGGAGVIDGDGGGAGVAGSVGATGEGSGGDGIGNFAAVDGSNGLIVLLWPTGFAV